ncbi:MAG: alpha/beta hydrolase-fold protein [Terracidiphilus sp.]|jgi:enterochelin esterase family protein
MQTVRFVAILVFSAACAAVCAAQTPAQPRSAVELIQLAKENSPQLGQAIQDTFLVKGLQSGTAWSGHLHDFFFAVRASSRPVLLIDDAPGPAMQSIPSTDLWYAAAQIERLGALHSFRYQVDGKDFGGSLNVPAFSELSYSMPGVKRGALSPKLTIASKIYDGMKADYWIYVPAGYDASVPAALMVFQDGGGYTDWDENSHTLNAIDNLIALKKIPTTICIFVNPGKIAGPAGNPTYDFVKAYSEKWHRTLDDSMRSTLYDTVSDRYPRFLRDELLPEVAARYNLRKDAYSHAITGLSSGGICSFNAAWQMPDLFSRVITWIGSFTSIQWKETPGVADGGQDYPEKVLREPHRNIRVWLQDGSDDMEWNQYGSWPLANVRMANALKLREYDFHFSFGKGSHNPAHGEAEFPEEMIWLWRDYDASKTGQTFEIEPSEKAKPAFRIAIFNRDAN